MVTPSSFANAKRNVSNLEDDGVDCSPRLLIVSSGNRNNQLLVSVTRRNVKIAMYQFENSSLDDILAVIIAELGGMQVDSIAFILHGSEKELYLTGIGNVILSSKTISEQQAVMEFFVCLASTFISKSNFKCRIDFLDCTLKDEIEVSRIAQKMAKLTNCRVSICLDLYGNEVVEFPKTESKHIPSGELYFHHEKLKEFLNIPLTSQFQNLSGYEKVRTVGKGAFGTAILYRKKDDDSLVIVKEINMHDLTANERQLAINEVSVLSMLNHENIVSYFDSFEEDGILMIEMEYADGGTLAQYLSQMKNPIEEKEILILFKQIVSAIKHMHDHNILHRDLKTANIFLTKGGTVKVGDFGISKMLTTRQGGAITVVGTPYYISPEMCEGKFYNQKSDIWALGCILYEMACQQKTFEGSNLPALVNKIVKGQFAPVKGNYSSDFKQLIRDLLQRDPDLRPTATELLDIRLCELIKDFEDNLSKDYSDMEISMDFNFQGLPVGVKNSLRQPRSVLYEIKMHQLDISLTSVALPPQSKIKEVALSSTHMIVLTAELQCYTWGDGRKGQLGHGSLETWREKPFCVEALKGKNITRICAGEGFSVFSSDNGIVMTCGNGSQGCLGHSDWNMCVKPKLIEKLLSVDVSAVSCGPHHVVVVGGDGEAYSWGCGMGGRLGIGKEEDCCIPTEVQFPNDVRAVKAFCGYDGTMFVTEIGTLLACGQNDFNKLGLNEQRGFLSQMKNFIAKTEVEKQLYPVKLGWLRQKVVSVSMGISHTAVLVEPGKLITFGCNKSGQLGRGNVRHHSTPSIVKVMGDRTVTMVQCGDTFTVTGTAENAVHFWGSRQVLSLPSSKNVSSEMRNSCSLKSKNVSSKEKCSKSCEDDYISEFSEASVSEVIKIGESNSPLMREIERIGPDSPIIQVKTPQMSFINSPSLISVEQQRMSMNTNVDGEKDNFVDSCTGRKDIILQPQEILALYASPAQIGKGEMVALANLFCYGSQVYLVVDTTAPLPRHSNKRLKETENILPLPSFHDIVNEKKCSVPEEDSLGPIPEWLKMELANAVVPSTARNDIETDGNFVESNKVESEGSIDLQKLNKVLMNSENPSAKGLLHERSLFKHNTLEVILKEELRKISLEKRQIEEKLQKLEKVLAQKNYHHKKELEQEIVNLKKEIQKHQKGSTSDPVEINDLQFFSDSTLKDEVKVQKKSFWPRSRFCKSSSRSRICLLQ